MQSSRQRRCRTKQVVACDSEMGAKSRIPCVFGYSRTSFSMAPHLSTILSSPKSNLLIAASVSSVSIPILPWRTAYHGHQLRPRACNFV